MGLMGNVGTRKALGRWNKREGRRAQGERREKVKTNLPSLTACIIAHSWSIADLSWSDFDACTEMVLMLCSSH